MQDASDRIDQGIQKVLSVGPCTWEGTSEKRMALVTNLGTIIRTNYAPSTSSRHDIIAIRGAKVATLGFHGNKDLDPGLFINMLRSETGVEASSSWTAPVPAEPQRPHIEMNHGIRHSHDAFSEELQGIDADMVILPPFTQRGGHDRAWRDLADEVGRRLCEVITPLSLPGRSLVDSFGRAARQAGARDLNGTILEKIDKRDDDVIALCRSGLRRVEVRAAMMLFCGGNAVGGGLDIRGRDVIDPLSFFDIRKGAAGPSNFDMVTHSGIAIDPYFRSVRKGARMDNVLVAGAALPGLNFANGYGLGACLTTALAACRAIEEEL
jgi:anaerobic glycerol-3-phosphate dehydrogenase